MKSTLFLSTTLCMFTMVVAGTANKNAPRFSGTDSVDPHMITDISEFENPHISVTNVEDLYSAINDSNNAGTKIVLTPGIYVLSAIDPNGLERPNRGRLELQEHMSLSGVRGDRAAVLIDASLLPASSFESPITGVIRVGFGSNAIEWLTINGHPTATASIETDLHWAAGPSRVSVAHVVTINGNRGIDVRNINALGREINVEINDSNFSGGLEGMRIVNQNNSPGARIFVRMTGNFVHDNEIGCLIANARVSEGTIRVQSIGDTFTGNGTGVLLNGGLIQGANIANSNYVSFEADGSRIINNNGPIFGPPGGLYAAAGQSGLLNATSNNTLDIHLRNCQIFGNTGTDFAAFGARSGANVLPGTNNRTRIYFYGPGRNNKVDATDSVPVEPGGTNTVTIINATTPFPGDLAWWR